MTIIKIIFIYNPLLLDTVPGWLHASLYSVFTTNPWSEPHYYVLIVKEEIIPWAKPCSSSIAAQELEPGLSDPKAHLIPWSMTSMSRISTAPLFLPRSSLGTLEANKVFKASCLPVLSRSPGTTSPRVPWGSGCGDQLYLHGPWLTKCQKAGKGSAGHLRLLNWPLSQMQPTGLFPSSRGQWWGGQGTDRGCHWAQVFKTSHITITVTTYQVPLVSRHHTDLHVLLLWKADRIMPILQLKKLRPIEFKWLFKASLTWE